MKITVEFDLTTDEGRSDFEEFKVMRRNARFWDEIYNECFRPAIKHGESSEHNKFTTVWNKVNEFRKDLEE